MYNQVNEVGEGDTVQTMVIFIYIRLARDFTSLFHAQQAFSIFHQKIRMEIGEFIIIGRPEPTPWLTNKHGDIVRAQHLLQADMVQLMGEGDIGDVCMISQGRRQAAPVLCPHLPHHTEQEAAVSLHDKLISRRKPVHPRHVYRAVCR